MLKDANNANNAHNTLALCALLTSFSMTHCLTLPTDTREQDELECGPMPNVMAALPNTGGDLCSTPQSLANAQYWSAMQ